MKRPRDDIADWRLQQENKSKPFPYYVPTRGDYRKAAETGPKNPRTGRPMWNLDMRRKEDPWRADRCLFGVWIC